LTTVSFGQSFRERGARPADSPKAPFADLECRLGSRPRGFEARILRHSHQRGNPSRSGLELLASMGSGGAAAGGRGFAAAADLIVKVKEPIPEEYDRFRPEQQLFTYLHLAADRRLTEFLLDRRIDSIAYETVQTRMGGWPLSSSISSISSMWSTGSRRKTDGTRIPSCAHFRSRTRADCGTGQ
jgi:hypothetical protein